MPGGYFRRSRSFTIAAPRTPAFASWTIRKCNGFPEAVRLVRQMLARKPKIAAKHLVRDDDLPWVRVTADTPVACQIDGDYVGLREEMTFRVVPEALGVVAPSAKRFWPA